MSQEKVARYKEAKANRKETIKKEKRKKMLRTTVATVICVAVLGWVGYSAVEYHKANKQREAVEVDYSAVNEYLEQLSVE